MSTKSQYHADLVAAHIIARRWLFWQSDVNEREVPMLLVDMRETMARHGERGPSIHAHVRAPSIAVFNAMSLLARPADILRYGAGTKSTG